MRRQRHSVPAHRTEFRRMLIGRELFHGKA
jgi:hypothetical protein